MELETTKGHFKYLPFLNKCMNSWCLFILADVHTPVQALCRSRVLSLLSLDSSLVLPTVARDCRPEQDNILSLSIKIKLIQNLVIVPFFVNEQSYKFNRRSNNYFHHYSDKIFAALNS